MTATSCRAWVCRCLVAALAAALVGGCGSDRSAQPRGAATTSAAATTAAEPSADEWGAPNANLSNTRRLDTAITAANVRRLSPSWSVPLLGTYAATPVVAGGVAYTADLLSNVYAIDLAGGRLKWRQTYNAPDTGPNGVSVADGRVYGVTSLSAYALDAASGRELWRRQLARRPGESVVMAPGYHDGAVFVSTVPSAGGDIGTLYALDAASGRPRWSWQEVPRSLWGNPQVNGGGGLWYPPAFDGDGGLYISIANPVPWPGTDAQPWGRSRPGPNRWNNSIVKLDERTGRFVWGTQALPHDLYDWDLQCPVILARAGGRRVAITAGKMGFVYAFDAEDGHLLWKRSVGIHNGHDDDSVRAMHGDYSNVGYGRRIYPGDWGGVETQMASDGSTVYVPVNDLYAIYSRQTLPRQQEPLQGTGEMVALDVASGRVKWIRKLPHGEYGGATITNDLVLTTTYEGTVWALDRATGAVVWKAPLPAGSIAPVAVTGDTLLSAGGIALNKRQHMAIVGFRLGGAARGG